MKKRILSVLLSFSLLFAGVLPCWAQGPAQSAYRDIKDHWAESAIEKWSGLKIIEGDQGLFRPNASMTRGELAVVLDRIMKYQTTAKADAFRDLQGHWAAEAVLKASAAGIVEGNKGLVRPGDAITRQEAAVMLARAFGLSGKDQGSVQFKDQDQIAGWAGNDINEMAEKGYMYGYKGYFRPKDNITRAEIITILDRVVARIYSSAGSYSEPVNGNVIVNTPDVVLKDMTITGDLVIAEGVGSGEVTLDNVTVKGSAFVRGGGANSVKIIGDSRLAMVVIEKKDGKVSVKVQGNASVQVVVIGDGSDDVNLQGVFDRVEVKAEDIEITAEKATIGSMIMSGDGAQVLVGKDTVVKDMKVESSRVVLKGEGKITNALIQGDDAKIDVAGTNVEVGRNVTGTSSWGDAIPGGTRTQTREAGKAPSAIPPVTGGGSPGGGSVIPPVSSIGVTAVSVDQSPVTPVNGEYKILKTAEGGKITLTPANFSNGEYAYTVAVARDGGAPDTRNGSITITNNSVLDIACPAGEWDTIGTYVYTITLGGKTATVTLVVEDQVTIDNIGTQALTYGTNGVVALGLRDQQNNPVAVHTGFSVTISENAAVAGTYDTAAKELTLTPREATDGAVTVTLTVSRTGYRTATKIFQVTVSKRALTVTGTSAVDRIYNGTSQVALTGGSLTGVVNSDQVTLSGSTTGDMADANAGGNKAVTTHYALSGTKAGNYALEQPSGITATISRAVLTARADNQSIAVNGSEPSYTVSVTGFVNGETEETALGYTDPVAACPSIDTAIARAYPITVSGGSAANYSFTYVSGTLTVTEEPLESVPAVSSIGFAMENGVLELQWENPADADNIDRLEVYARKQGESDWTLKCQTQPDQDRIDLGCFILMNTSSGTYDIKIISKAKTGFQNNEAVCGKGLVFNAGTGNTPVLNTAAIQENQITVISPDIFNGCQYMVMSADAVDQSNTIGRIETAVRDRALTYTADDTAGSPEKDGSRLYLYRLYMNVDGNGFGCLNASARQPIGTVIAAEDLVSLDQVGVYSVSTELEDRINSSALPDPAPDHLPYWTGVHLPNKMDFTYAYAGLGSLMFEEADVKRAADMGFNFLRVPIHYKVLCTDSDETIIKMSQIRNIDKLIEWGIKYNVHINLDLHYLPGHGPSDNGIPVQDLFSNFAEQQLACDYWAMLAKRYAGIPNKILSFNLLNEPHFEATDAQYADLMGRIATAVRAQDPDRLMIIDGLQAARTPSDASKSLGVAQSMHNYAPDAFTTTPGSDAGGGLKNPLPQDWPMPYVNGALWTSQTTTRPTKLTINGSFAAGTIVKVYVEEVPGSIDLVIQADGTEIKRQSFTPSGTHVEVTTVLPGDTGKIEISDDGAKWAWMQVKWVTIVQPDQEPVTVIATDYNYDPAATATTINIGADGIYTDNNPAEMLDITWMRAKVKVWKDFAAANNIGIMCGEFGVINTVPHDMTLKYLRDWLTVLKENGIGWCLWDYWGGFGFLNSNRQDVTYEACDGLWLDREMLTLLQEFQ